MQDSWNDVQKLIDELKFLLLKSGVPERQVTMPEASPQWIRPEKYIEVFDWLHNLKLSPEYLAAGKAWAMVKPDVWAMYELHGFTGLTEQLILQEALSNLRKRWKLNRPSFFGRKFRDNTDDPSESETDAEQEAYAAKPDAGEEDSP